MGRHGRIKLTVLALAVAFLALSSAAHADDWRPVGLSCVNAAGTDGCANGTASFGGAWNVVVSPDGRHAYTANYNANAVQLLDRDGATGALAPRGGATACIAEVASATCSDGRALTFPDGIAISPDGRFVYVASWGTGTVGAVAIFSRSEDTGLLTQLGGAQGCINDDGSDGCTNGVGLAPSVARDVTMSADGASVYVGGNPIAVFDRNAVTGALTQKAGTAGCVATPLTAGCAPGRSLGGGRQSALSPDGQSLYVPSVSGVAVFDRAADGAITQKGGTAGCITVAVVAGCATEPRLGGGVLAALASPGGGQVYVSSDAGMFTFARGGGGELGLQSCVTAAPVGGCATAQNVFDLSYSAISPDGQDVVATRDLGGPSGMVFFSRDAAGNLTRRAGEDGCISADGSAFDGGTPVPGACRSYPVVTTDGHVSFVGNSFFYAGFYSGSAVAAFEREFYPQCAGATVSVAHNTSAAVPLSCSDRDGDPLALAIAQAPISGSLGAIDAAQGRVFYNPFGGFSGTDGFSYHATGGGLTSPPAHVALNVAAAPPPPPPEPKRITSKVRVTWGVSGKRIYLLRLKATKVPKGGKLQLRCAKAKKCPFKRKSSKKRKNSKITLFKQIKASKVAGKKKRTFRAGQRLEVRITAKDYIGKVVRYKLKKGKIPNGKELCLPDGAKKPRKTCG